MFPPVSALLAPVFALIGMGFGAVIRHTATNLVTTAGMLLLLPDVFNDSHLFGPGPYPQTIAGSWSTYAAWLLVAVCLALVVVHHRDVGCPTRPET
ncbi:hypothetical protein [Streptomyces sp. NPDC007205]|uniref:hypothetical protein n=1 Tax=Streptomyces sp. NPDC007205 TaxID=3154316 RepID=UPI00340B0E9B